ncbi:hypothetical protein [Aureimonas pseudogalii]|uniref:Uncharacterized protein n=1 Tax=Aureimonas pseudogalii TaxID=1744844 RepID=A0A7W6EBZ3_9HYPH|nr:hypothetical protein [Aureimonas pseudogalii]MBB3997226.1 hypothetical protein [Aureimonas pseudogalii]
MTKSATVLSDEESALIGEMATKGMGSMLISRAFAERGRTIPNTTIASLKLYRDAKRVRDSIRGERVRAEEEAQREARRIAVPDAPVFPKFTRMVPEIASIWFGNDAPRHVAVSLRATSMDALV